MSLILCARRLSREHQNRKMTHEAVPNTCTLVNRKHEVLINVVRFQNRQHCAEPRVNVSVLCCGIPSIGQS